MDEKDYSTIILYYGRNQFYHLMQNKSLDAMKLFPSEQNFRLFNGFSLILGNRVHEGIRELSPMESDQIFGLAAILSLIHGHKKCSVIDKETVKSLEQRLKEQRRKLNAESAYFAGIFLLLNGNYEKAIEFADKSIKLSPTLNEAIVLKGWSELMNGTRSESCLDLFKKVLVHEKCFDAFLGQIRYYQLTNHFEAAISVLNHLSIRYQELNIPLIEKMRTQLASWDWDAAIETCERILTLEPSNIDALLTKALCLICTKGNFTEAMRFVQKLFAAMNDTEPLNGDLFLCTGQVLARVCGRNEVVLESAMTFVDKANKISPANAEYLSELGYISILLDKKKEAQKYYRSATKCDDTSISALCGLTLCQLEEMGTNEQVRQQIEFLNEIQGTTKNPLILFMSSKVTATDSDKAIALLIEACEVHLKNLKTIMYGVDYLRCFDADFLLQIAHELIKYSPIQLTLNVDDVAMKNQMHLSLKHSYNILEMIVKASPGNAEAIYHLAKVQYLSGDIDQAIENLQFILSNINDSHIDAHLLIVQIHIHQRQFEQGNLLLDVCLSRNFIVRENHMYHMLKGMIFKEREKYDDALKSFQVALKILGIDEMSKDKTETKSFATADKVTLYLQMIDSYMILNQNDEANQWMEQISNEFGDSPEKGRVIIAHADLMLHQGNSGKALELLRTIQPGDNYYMQAKVKIAYVHLNAKKDRTAFIRCFQELIEDYPVTETFLMLSDAYMSIQEPDEAIDALKMASRNSPHDVSLYSKLGRAYIKTHQYTKAVNHYKEICLTRNDAAIKLDLAELYLKLGQYPNAEQILTEDNKFFKGGVIDGNVEELQNQTKILLLLARVREKSGQLKSALITLKEARECQMRAQRLISHDDLKGASDRQTILSKICTLMAELCVTLRDNPQAVSHYKEALKHSPNNKKIMTALAQLYVQMDLMHDCQEICSMILKLEPSNDTASIIMADISLQKMKFDDASHHFSQLLNNQPTSWTALSRLIDAKYRIAKTAEVVPFIKRAEQKCMQPTQEPGLSYCKGLFEWYNCNPNLALRYFNNARRGTEWNQDAIFRMIEICLNPDNDLPNENLSESDEDLLESRSMALRTAERLLQEIRPTPANGLKLRILTNFLHLSTRQKYSIEIASNDFSEILSLDEYKDHVGATLGLATAHVQLKQMAKAKNVLKKTIEMTWTLEDAETLERCWLILADIYAQDGKNNTAEEILGQIIAHNKSSTKAYELWAQIGEKEQIYRTAAIRYELAWNFCGKSRPIIGYKLAFCLMKSRRFAEAISVCQSVLKLHPDYGIIRNDIMNKCKANIKT